MSDKKLGQLIQTEEYPDAIHIAIAPVTSDDGLKPGQHVGLDAISGKATTNGIPIGIVDPFLAKETIVPGERFWLLLCPGTITSLRHDWTHPSFGPQPPPPPPPMPKTPNELSQEWLVNCARELDIGYNQMMGSAMEWLRSEELEVQLGRSNWRDDFPGVAEEFWKHYDIVMGTTVPEAKRCSFFSCSC